MKRIVLTTSQTGGVGKSTFSCALVDIARGMGIATAAYDADTRPGRVGKLLKRYGERNDTGDLCERQNPVRGVGYFDARNPKTRELLVGLVDEQAELVVVDLPGGSLSELADVVPGGLSGLTRMYREYGWEPTIAIVITPVLICTEEVVDVLPRLANCEANIVAVKTFVGADHTTAPEDLDDQEFFLFNGDGGELSQGRARTLLHELGGRELFMPAIRSRSHTYVDARVLPFCVAAQRDDSLPKYRGDQRWIRAWLDDVRGRMIDVGLLPDPEAVIVHPKAALAS